MKLLPVVRGWGWTAGPSSAVVPYRRRVEPIEPVADKQDYEEEREAERMYLCQSVGSTYNKKGKVNRESCRPGRRLSCKA